MNNPGLIKTFIAEGVIEPYRIVKFGSTDGKTVKAAAATDALLGVTALVAAGAAGEPVDVILTGAAEVEYGGTIARGDLLTTDSTGRAIKAAPAVGSNVRVLGMAAVSGATGDIGSVLISQGSMQG